VEEVESGFFGSIEYFNHFIATPAPAVVDRSALAVPGTAGQSIPTTFTLTGANSIFANEFDIFPVDDATGRIGALWCFARNQTAGKGYALNTRSVMSTKNERLACWMQFKRKGETGRLSSRFAGSLLKAWKCSMSSSSPRKTREKSSSREKALRWRLLTRFPPNFAPENQLPDRDSNFSSSS